MGVGTALSAGVSPSGIETSGADKVRDLFTKGSDSNKVKPSCYSPDKVKKTPSRSKYGSPSTGSSGGRERKIHEKSRFKFNKRGNYRSRGTRIIRVTSPSTSDRPTTRISRQTNRNYHHSRHGHHLQHQPLLYQSRWHQHQQQQRQQQAASSDQDNCSSTNITLSAREKERYIREVLGIKKTNFPVATLLSHPRCGSIQLEVNGGSRENSVQQRQRAQPNQTRITCYLKKPAATSTSPARPSSSRSIDSLRAPRAPQHLRTRGYRDIT